jgi:glycosyltransferase involved in cell wall biosynthesis
VRIAFDAYPLVNQHARHGIGKTTRRLLEALDRSDPTWCPYDLWYYLRNGAWRRPPTWTRIKLRQLGDTEDVWRAAAEDGAHLLHVNDYFFPLYSPDRVCGAEARDFRVVVTVRDIIPLHYPSLKQRSFRRLRRNLFPLLQQADHIIAISQWTKHDLVTQLHLAEERITVIHHGVDHDIFHDRYPPDQIAAVARRYGLGGAYILYVAGMDIRKNHRLLIDSLYYLNRMNPPGCSLALVGPGRTPADIRTQITQRRLWDRVRILGEVPLCDLPLLYAGARLFAFPSVYEGFGNPLLEAMACGAPVVGLRRSTIPEVTGEAAVLVDDNDYEAFGQAMARVLFDPKLAAALREKGRVRAGEFTWERTARLTCETYGRVLAARSTTTSP